VENGFDDFDVLPFLDRYLLDNKIKISQEGDLNVICDAIRSLPRPQSQRTIQVTNIHEWFDAMSFTTNEKCKYKRILIDNEFFEWNKLLVIKEENLTNVLIPFGHQQRIFISKSILLPDTTQQDVPLASVTGQPIVLFDPNFVPTTDIFVAAEEGVEIWNDEPKQLAKEAVWNHIESKKQIITKYNLDICEAGAIAYWTMSEQPIRRPEAETLYKVLNSTLITRDQTILQKWQPFLYYLMKGLSKLPSFNGLAYRGLKGRLTKISNQYFINNEIVWIAFTSTSKKQEIPYRFIGNGEGTMMVIQVIDGKEIKDLSLISHEDEVLLAPNTRVKVVEIYNNDNIDVIMLQQLKK